MQEGGRNRVLSPGLLESAPEDRAGPISSRQLCRERPSLLAPSESNAVRVLALFAALPLPIKTARVRASALVSPRRGANMAALCGGLTAPSARCRSLVGREENREEAPRLASRVAAVGTALPAPRPDSAFRSPSHLAWEAVSQRGRKAPSGDAARAGKQAAGAGWKERDFGLAVLSVSVLNGLYRSRGRVALGNVKASWLFGSSVRFNGGLSRGCKPLRGRS